MVIAEQIRSFPIHISEENLVTVRNMGENLGQIQEFTWAHFHENARMTNDNNEAPWINWLAINREPEAWVAHALATNLVENTRERVGDEGVVVIGLPGSATWMSYQMERDGLVPNAYYPTILKPSQYKEFGFEEADFVDAKQIDVRSYTKNTLPDGSRGVDPMFMPDHVAVGGQIVFLFDDAAADLYSIIDSVRALDEMGAKEIHVAVALRKMRQGARGMRYLKKIEKMKSFFALVAVENTHGEGNPMDVAMDPNDYNWENVNGVIQPVGKK